MHKKNTSSKITMGLSSLFLCCVFSLPLQATSVLSAEEPFSRGRNSHLIDERGDDGDNFVFSQTISESLEGIEDIDFMRRLVEHALEKCRTLEERLEGEDEAEYSDDEDEGDAIITHLRASLDELKERNQALEESLRDRDEALDDSDAANSTLRRRNTFLNQEVERLEEELEEKKGVEEALREKRRKIELLEAEKRTQREGFYQDISELEEEKEAFQKSESRLQKQVGHFKKEKREMQNALQEIKEEALKSANSFRELQDRHSGLSETLERVRYTSRINAEKAEAYLEERQAMSEVLSQTQRALAQLSGVQGELEFYRDLAGSLQHRQTSQNSLGANLGEELSRSIEERNVGQRDLQPLLDEAIAARARAETERNQAREQMQLLQSQLENSSAEKSQLQEQLTAEQAKTAQLQGALEDLGTQLASVNAEKSRLQEQLAQKQVEIEELRVALGALNSRLSNAQASGVQARDAQAEAERERDVLQSQLETSNAERLRLQERLAQQQAETEQLRVALGALNSQLSNAQASGDQARDAQAEAERERDVLREAFSQLYTQIRESEGDNIQLLVGWMDNLLKEIQFQKNLNESDESRRIEATDSVKTVAASTIDLEEALQKISALQQAISAERIANKALLREKNNESRLIKEQMTRVHQNYQLEREGVENQLKTSVDHLHSGQSYISKLHKTLKDQTLRLKVIKKLEGEVSSLKAIIEFRFPKHASESPLLGGLLDSHRPKFFSISTFLSQL